MLNQSVNARLNAACAPHSGGDNQAFFYIDGIPTKGCWVDLNQVGAWEDVELQLSQLFPSAVIDEVLCADVEGLASIFYTSSCDYFNLAAWFEFFSDFQSSSLSPEVVLAYASNFVGFEDVTIQNIEDSYMGEYSSNKDFAENYADDSGLLFNVPETVKYYFDYDAYWYGDLRHSFWEADGHYFHNL